MHNAHYPVKLKMQNAHFQSYETGKIGWVELLAVSHVFLRIGKNRKGKGMSDSASGFSMAALIAAAFLLLLPALVIASRGRLPLQIAALLLCALGIVALVGAAAGAATSGLSLIVTMPVAAGLWFAGLFCALAAWSDAAHERRMKELTVRLLMNDANGLGNPEDYRKGWFG